MTWRNLREDIEDMFSLCEGHLDLEGRIDLGTTDSIPDGYHLHESLSLSRLTTHEFLTSEQRIAKRKTLELKRRAYRTAKQREYDAKKKEVA